MHMHMHMHMCRAAPSSLSLGELELRALLPVLPASQSHPPRQRGRVSVCSLEKGDDLEITAGVHLEHLECSR